MSNPPNQSHTTESQRQNIATIPRGKVGGCRRWVLEAHEDWIRERISSEIHVSLRKLQAELADRVLAVGYGAVQRTVHRLGLILTRGLHVEEATKPDIARRRHWWRKLQARIESSPMLFIDEIWVKINMAPLRGWRSQGLKTQAPHGHWKTLTFLAAF